MFTVADPGPEAPKKYVFETAPLLHLRVWMTAKNIRSLDSYDDVVLKGS